MAAEVLVKVEGLSKKFCKDLKTSLWYGVKDLVSGITGSQANRPLRDKEFWAVKDISFELRRGECLGLIGHNGAGKSTLLKILNGLINPDEGSVTMRGRVGALIELGAGFNPILTGRENIYNNGAVLGFTRKEIDAKVEEIIDFSEIREFIDMPVQNYSSGMKVRLGFSVAVQMEPDVLIIDEVLAVGDANFIVKSYNRINELIKTCAVIFVSHSMPQVAKLVDKIIYLERGIALEYSKNKNEVINNYLSKQVDIEAYSVTGGENVKTFDILKNTKSILNSEIEIDFMSNLNINTSFKLTSLEDEFCSIVVKFFDSELRPCSVFQSKRTSCFTDEVNLDITINSINLSPGVYAVTIWLLSHVDENNPDETIVLGVESAFRLRVVGESISNFAFSRYKGSLINKILAKKNDQQIIK
ncbi:ABC transporter ATP-binding protein [Flavobacteriaceae bacterium]|nr:ABC transporter ATP-binding protein [Flavobacteriaceae bacterium]